MKGSGDHGKGGGDWGGDWGGEWAPSWEDMAALFASMKGGWGEKGGDWGKGEKGGKASKGGWGKGDKGGWGDKGKGKFGKGKGKDGGKDGKGMGKAAMKLAAGESVYHGAIKQFTPEKKSGFIACDAIYAEAGQEVYAYQDVLEKAMAGPGDYVAFFIHWSSRGQPQASNPMIRLGCSDGMFALKGTYKPGKDPTGFGFLDCPPTKEYFGRDIYVHKDLAVTMTPGETYRFNAYLNRDNMPNASEAEPCEPEWEPIPTDLTEFRRVEVDGKGKSKGGKGKGGKGGKGGKDGGGWGDEWGSAGYDDWYGGKALAIKGGGKADGKGYGKVVPGKFGGKSAAPATGAGPPTSTGRQCFGTLKSFNAANNYGFIECEEVSAEYGGDCFAHGRAFVDENIEVGQAVLFELAINAKGKPQALNVTADPTGGAGAGSGGDDDPIAAALAELDTTAPPAAKRARMAANTFEWGESDLDQMLMG